jgi:hypothetical protein
MYCTSWDELFLVKRSYVFSLQDSLFVELAVQYDFVKESATFFIKFQTKDNSKKAQSPKPKTQTHD